MPRQARLDIPGALHHIMIRGIDKTNIFYDSEDKERFLERLVKNVEESQCVIYAWVLMVTMSIFYFEADNKVFLQL